MFMIEKALAGSRSYWTWMLACRGHRGWVLCYLRQLTYGLGITGS